MAHSIGVGSKDSTQRLGRIVRHIVLLSATVVSMLPFLWTFSTSLKTRSDILTWPPTWLPPQVTFENYISVLTGAHFLQFSLNSIIVTTATVILSVVVSCLAGYVTARFDFPGKNILMFLVLAGMAIGRFANVIPLYFFAQRIGLLDSYLILIISYSAFVAPITTWLMQSYYKAIPTAMEEAARIDGCSPFEAYWRVIVPVTRPAMVAAAVIAMVHAWNEFILALVLTSSTSMRTLPVGLHYFLTDYGVQWGDLTAAAIVSIIPVLVVFLILQRYFIQGLTSGTLGSA